MRQLSLDCGIRTSTSSFLLAIQFRLYIVTACDTTQLLAPEKQLYEKVITTNVSFLAILHYMFFAVKII